MARTLFELGQIKTTLFSGRKNHPCV